MNENQFEELWQHLDRVLPDIESFCLSAGYEFVDARSLGRYPRIRVEKKGEINCWIELWMELDEKGIRYERFFEEVPYELSAGAFIDIADKTEYGHRFQKSFILFSHKYFKDVSVVIVDELKKANEKLVGWNKDTLMVDGQKVELG
ncbi:MAG: hypothetical protein ACRBHB_21805 [Arenicella sp.]